jgi:hypothetical protein
MTTQQVTQGTRSSTSTRVATVTVAGALALAVAAVSIATWQGARPAPATEEAPAGVGSAVASTLGDTVPVTDRELPQPGQQRSGTPLATVYLVATEAQAQALRLDLAKSDAIRAAQGQPMLPHGVLWFDAAEAEVQFWATQQMLGSGAATAVIDLRPSAVAGAIETVYLVSTPEQAEALRARITADADQLGTLRPNARVVVEGSDEAAIALHVINDIVPAGLIRLVDGRTP